MMAAELIHIMTRGNSLVCILTVNTLMFISKDEETGNAEDGGVGWLEVMADWILSVFE